MAPTAPAEGPGAALTALPQDFYGRDPRLVAVDLLGKVLVAGGRSGRIVETEAYLGTIDAAAHSYRRRSARNATMFGPPGRLYVYFTYGMHWCCNPVCGEEDEPVAVLIRALAPLSGLDEMRSLRSRARRDRDLCNGPAKLCQALGIDGSHDGADLTRPGSGVAIVDDGTPPPEDPVVTTRIGISQAVDEPWRWYVRDDPHVSRR